MAGCYDSCDEWRRKDYKTSEESGVIEGLGRLVKHGVRLIRRLLELCGDALSYLGSRGPHPQCVAAVERLPTILGYGVMITVSYVSNDISRCQLEIRNGRAEAQCTIFQCIGDMLCGSCSLSSLQSRDLLWYKSRFTTLSTSVDIKIRYQVMSIPISKITVILKSNTERQGYVHADVKTFLPPNASFLINAAPQHALKRTAVE